jgi:hypothetical protein
VREIGRGCSVKRSWRERVVIWGYGYGIVDIGTGGNRGWKGLCASVGMLGRIAGSRLGVRRLTYS